MQSDACSSPPPCETPLQPPRFPILTLDEVRAHCKGRLGGFKAPRQLVVREALPRNLSGKVLKRALVQITGASGKRRIRRYIIVLKGLPSKQQAQWYL
ncbi:hypothetical protein [Cupriavidus sp. SK-3]|uniref:hypothetical protein n=1 Tax=Cupriavidus sp. SK-3 TaxID=1470558 RepID=UPI0009DEFAFD|nr:hypothetical protein [Cupriavidus sp. SK-3]